MILDLIKAAALLLSLSLLQGLIVRSRLGHTRFSQLLSGCLFGGICVVGMMAPIVVTPGVIFDPRSVILSMAGLFGGPLVSAVATLIAGGYRVWLGGGGMPVGVAVVVMSSAFGLGYRYARARGWVRVDVSHLLVFGIVLHLTEIGLFTMLPARALPEVMDSLVLPLLVIFTPATAFLGLLLRDLEDRLKLEKDLVDSEARLSLHLQNTPLAAISWDRNLGCLQWNRAAEKIFGYTAEEMVGNNGLDMLVSPEGRAQMGDVFQRLISRIGGERHVNENITKDGRTIICEWYNTPIADDLGNTVGVVSLAEDITDKRRAEEELKLKNTLLITQQEASVDAILSVDDHGKTISMNQRFIDLWQLPAEVVASQSDDRMIGVVLDKLVDPKLFLERIRYLYDHREEDSQDEILLKDGSVLERHSAPMSGPDGQYYGRVWMFRDITARRESEAVIWRQANLDPLTGLANRQMLRDRLEQEMRKCQRSGQRIALLYLDLDHFKDVNDTLGHDVGDLLLLDAAKRIKAHVRDADTVARLGGDEFIIVMGELTETSGVQRVAENILQVLAEPFRLGEESAYVSTSIGITFYPQDASDVDELLKHADQAMYAAKDMGRNRYRYYTGSMQRRALHRMMLEKDMREALACSDFRLYYQPIVALADGEIHKAEALIRWQHPQRGVVNPSEFIPVAEETRLILEIGDWVFREAARQVVKWRNTHKPNFQVSINTSPVQYRSDQFDVADWLGHLQRLDLADQAVVMEITEGLLLDATPSVSEKLLEFHDHGVQVSVDDFGTGYSSLSYLKKFHIDYLKIDQSFVCSLQPDSDDLTLCQAIIVIAHTLGMRVIAEGIETEQQCNLLRDAGCDYGQGYWFSRPVPADEFSAMLAG